MENVSEVQFADAVLSRRLVPSPRAREIQAQEKED
jgi:hypothetical protein